MVEVYWGIPSQRVVPSSSQSSFFWKAEVPTEMQTSTKRRMGHFQGLPRPVWNQACAKISMQQIDTSGFKKNRPQWSVVTIIGSITLPIGQVWSPEAPKFDHSQIATCDLRIPMFDVSIMFNPSCLLIKFTFLYCFEGSIMFNPRLCL